MKNRVEDIGNDRALEDALALLDLADAKGNPPVLQEDESDDNPATESLKAPPTP